MQFDVLVKLKNKEKLIKNIKIKLMGRHNVLNATAALALGLLLKIKIDDIKKSFENFSGVQRRLTLIFNKNNNLIYDDYAHHPTEIKAVLSACRNNFGDKKIISIFQPHRFSRVNSLYKDFTKSFNHSDQVVICPIYSAGEKNNNFNFQKFCEKISKNSKTELIKVNDKDELENFLRKNLTKNQIVVALGAGSISAWIREISNKLMNVKH
jgi:UDP-N-acetylmuramate--alanine ligase